MREEKGEEEGEWGSEEMGRGGREGGGMVYQGGERVMRK